MYIPDVFNISDVLSQYCLSYNKILETDFALPTFGIIITTKNNYHVGMEGIECTLCL